MPSVRDLALQTKVNPNTMQRALIELENLGLIYTERTNGKFVTDNQELIDRYKQEYANELTKTYFDSMLSIGMDKMQVANYLNKIGGIGK